ncbi:hypothetical protein [Stackebrandtia nassauensis]|uniref:Uncharacterized protein n=1 Tax=Stackebrandtia nassauensis (strain DSM 44728 / CIP 108903 / NRRL B-16338 / NBRC 102104 / LLR-40K-21) TaxID=446470 RepID=D3Q115_STANL|nr:hypothetical protein [Stackebrandtia nassauensis]ADD43765.1 hypothetical protein Snas_4114 [Stackebrandtia nassauensis DSM 44728]
MTTQPAPADPRGVTPGKFWYWIAGIIIVLGIAAGVTVFVFGVSTIAGNIPDMKQTFADGEETTVELSPNQDWAIYVDASGDTPPTVDCGVASDDGKAMMTPSSDTFNFSDGGHQWHLVYDVSVDKSGEYTFTCTAGEAADGYAIGDGVDVGGFVGGVFGSLGGLIGIPCFSLVVGGVIILIVAMRRSGNKKKLRQTPDAPGAW